MERMPGPSHPDVRVTQAVADIGRGVDALERLLAMQREMIGLLGSQLRARTREVQELHLLLQAMRGHAPDVAPVVATLATSLSHVSGRLDEATAELREARRHIRDQAETIGREGGELAAERERGKMYHTEAERARAEVTRVTAERDAADAYRRRYGRRLSIAVAVAATLAIIGALAPAWAGWLR